MVNRVWRDGRKKLLVNWASLNMLMVWALVGLFRVKRRNTTWSNATKFGSMSTPLSSCMLTMCTFPSLSGTRYQSFSSVEMYVAVLSIVLLDRIGDATTENFAREIFQIFFLIFTVSSPAPVKNNNAETRATSLIVKKILLRLSVALLIVCRCCFDATF